MSYVYPNANPSVPGGPNSPMETQSVTAYIDGLEVDEGNLLPDAESQRNAIAEALAGILGTYNCLMSDAPVVITSSPSSYSLSLGGPYQRIFVQGRLVDYIPVTTFTAGDSDPVQGRYDLIAVQYTLTPNPFRTQDVEDISGGIAPTAISQNQEGLTWQYIAGTPGAGVPATPAGFEAFASVFVAGGASGVTSTSFIFPTVQQQLITGKTVSSLNGLVNAITLLGGTGVTVTVSGQNIILSFSPVGVVASLNGETGAVVIEGGAGIGVSEPTSGIILLQSSLILVGAGGVSCTKSEDGTTWTISASATVDVSSLNGLTGALTLTGADGVGVASSGTGIVISIAKPIGTVLAAVNNFSPLSTQGVTVGVLPAGTWIVEAWCHGFDLLGSGSASLVGGGSGFTNTSEVHPTGSGGSTRTLFIAGTVAGGVTPTATATFGSGSGVITSNTFCTLLMKATRIA